MPTHKSAPQLEWEKAPRIVNGDTGIPAVMLSRRQFNALCRKFYRRGMERAAVEIQESVPYEALAIRELIADGAKDE